MCEVLKKTINKLENNYQEKINSINNQIAYAKGDLHSFLKDDDMERFDETYKRLKNYYTKREKLELLKKEMKFLSKIKE